jgi:TolB-like protein/DNA-binding winged helix-turn-helix (wHTH) protein/Flp pilus assembly protein TadD
MDALAPADILAFEGFRLDRRLGSLLKQDQDGAWRPVAIGSRALDVLSVLADRQATLLSKEEIMAAAWPGTVVEDNNLAVQISALRRILDRDRAEGSCIQTIPGRSYRFLAPVTQCEAETPPTTDAFAHLGDDALAIMDARAIGFGVSGEREQGSAPASRRNRRFPRGAIGALMGFLLLLGGAAGWYLHSPGSTGVHPPPRLSMVVLPFTNLSADREQQYFADGITEDLTTDLSRIPDILVISRDSAFTYQDKSVNAKQIGSQLGVRYVLEGSVQRSGNQVRVNAQLINAETDTHLWAERFDREISDLFALQSEITSRVAIALNLELIGVEVSRPNEHPDTMDYIFRGRAAFLKPQSRDNYAEAIGQYERALALDPQSVEAQSSLAAALAGRVLEEMTDSRAADIVRAQRLAQQASTTSPRNPLANYAEGQVLRAENRYKEAIPEYEAAIASNRNWVNALSALADCKLHAGPIEQVIPLQEQVVRLSPRDPLISSMYGRIGIAYLLQSRTDEAIVWLEKARDANPARLPPHSFLASAYGLKGETERAAAELAEARKLVSDDRFSSIARQRVRVAKYFENPAIRALFETTHFAGLRKAGVPEK